MPENVDLLLSNFDLALSHNFDLVSQKMLLTKAKFFVIS